MNYDDLLSLIRSRRSIRQFTQQPVGRGLLEQLLEAARWAPSNHNRQGWKFIVLENRDEIRRLSGRVRESLVAKLSSLPAVAASHADDLLHHATFFGGAPLLILVLHRVPVGFSNTLLKGLTAPGLVSGEPLSAAMAVQNLILAAQTLGLGSCVLTAPLLVEEVILRTLNPPPGFQPTCLVALGYPAETPEAPRRKTLNHIVEYKGREP